MKRFVTGVIPLGLAAAVLCGCATATVESRKQEKYGAYSELSPEMREAVDKGQIKIGMSMDAVYIAWGKPSRVLTGESSGGTAVTWLYYGTTMQEHRYWGYRYGYGGRGYRYYGPRMEVDYSPVNYTRAEVIFEGGVVKSWRTMAE